MFVGHFAMGLAASRQEPRLSLGLAFVAAQLPDVLWPYFVLAGVERVAIAPGDTEVTPLRFESYPWSHSLVMVVAWGALLAISGRLAGLPRRAAALLAPLAISHWLLDVASHRADMPLFPGGGPLLGLGLWHSRPLTLAVEGALFAAAVAFYARSAHPGLRFWSLVATLSVAYLANLFGPPPPNVTAVALSTIVLAPVMWVWGEAAHREATAPRT